MWRGASEQKIEATRGYGGTVDLEATGPADAFDRLHQLIEETGRTLVHPFDDPAVMAGAGTVGLEIEEDAPDADTVVVPVGGGGLIGGIVAALGTTKRIVGVEPEGSRALYDGLEAGHSIDVATDTIADGLNAPFAGTHALELCRDIEVVLVTDEEIKTGFRFLYERAKLACEPAGAAAAAALIAGKVVSRAPVAVVSGGNVSAQTASDILAFR
jgi:threonine dehydratase